MYSHTHRLFNHCDLSHTATLHPHMHSPNASVSTVLPFVMVPFCSVLGALLPCKQSALHLLGALAACATTCCHASMISICAQSQRMLHVQSSRSEMTVIAMPNTVDHFNWSQHSRYGTCELAVWQNPEGSLILLMKFVPHLLQPSLDRDQRTFSLSWHKMCTRPLTELL